MLKLDDETMLMYTLQTLDEDLKGIIEYYEYTYELKSDTMYIGYNNKLSKFVDETKKIFKTFSYDDRFYIFYKTDVLLLSVYDKEDFYPLEDEKCIGKYCVDFVGEYGEVPICWRFETEKQRDIFINYVKDSISDHR